MRQREWMCRCRSGQLGEEESATAATKLPGALLLKTGLNQTISTWKLQTSRRLSDYTKADRGRRTRQRRHAHKWHRDYQTDRLADPQRETTANQDESTSRMALIKSKCVIVEIIPREQIAVNKHLRSTGTMLTFHQIFPARFK